MMVQHEGAYEESPSRHGAATWNQELIPNLAAFVALSLEEDLLGIGSRQLFVRYPSRHPATIAGLQSLPSAGVALGREARWNLTQGCVSNISADDSTSLARDPHGRNVPCVFQPASGVSAVMFRPWRSGPTVSLPRLSTHHTASRVGRDQVQLL